MVPPQTAFALYVVRYQDAPQSALPLPESGQHISQGAALSYASCHAASFRNFSSAHGVFSCHAVPYERLSDRIQRYHQALYRRRNLSPSVSVGVCQCIQLYKGNGKPYFSLRAGTGSYIFLFASAMRPRPVPWLYLDRYGYEGRGSFRGYALSYRKLYASVSLDKPAVSIFPLTYIV